MADDYDMHFLTALSGRDDFWREVEVWGMRAYQGGIQCEHLRPTSGNKIERGVQAQEMDETETVKASELVSTSVSIAPWIISSGRVAKVREVRMKCSRVNFLDQGGRSINTKEWVVVNLPAIPRFEDTAKPVF